MEGVIAEVVNCFIIQHSRRIFLLLLLHCKAHCGTLIFSLILLLFWSLKSIWTSSATSCLGCMSTWGLVCNLSLALPNTETVQWAHTPLIALVVLAAGYVIWPMSRIMLPSDSRFPHIFGFFLSSVRCVQLLGPFSWGFYYSHARLYCPNPPVIWLWLQRLQVCSCTFPWRCSDLPAVPKTDSELLHSLTTLPPRSQYFAIIVQLRHHFGLYWCRMHHSESKGFD